MLPLRFYLCWCNTDAFLSIVIERADLEKQLQAAEQRAQEAEKKLKEMERKLVAAEEKAATAQHEARLAEEKAAHAEQATLVAQKRTELAEEQVVELERKLYEAENDLEELVVRDTERMALQSANAQSSSNSSLKILRSSCNSLSGYYVAEGGEEEGEGGGAGDELSITSL